ncbi:MULTISPECIES: hypothetical protein [Streptomyces]|uniref:hypothetical protein n=1 Tax=Streptomyces TaxID=1883 RepID=UPI0015E27A8E|nr:MULTISPECIES: hypothetical protein [Streptomyces]
MVRRIAFVLTGLLALGLAAAGPAAAHTSDVEGAWFDATRVQAGDVRVENIHAGEFEID